jgi:hypothetical protein
VIYNFCLQNNFRESYGYSHEMTITKKKKLIKQHIKKSKFTLVNMMDAFAAALPIFFFRRNKFLDTKILT